MKFEALLGMLITLLGGTTLGYFLLPKRIKVKFEEKIREDLYERVKHLEDVVNRQNELMREYVLELGQLRAEVAECRKLHGKM